MDHRMKTAIAAAYTTILSRGQHHETDPERLRARAFWKPWRETRAEKARLRLEETERQTNERQRTRSLVPPVDLPVDPGAPQKQFDF